jgi:CheY-like chemotaxis protein
MVSSRDILLADDNEDDVLLMLSALKKAKLMNEVVVVKDGLALLDYLFGRGEYEGRDLNKLPQLIILDIDMPKVNGLQALNKNREHERTRYLPVIVHTGSTDDRICVASRMFGANIFLQKCVGFDNLTDAVRQYVS